MTFEPWIMGQSHVAVLFRHLDAGGMLALPPNFHGSEGEMFAINVWCLYYNTDMTSSWVLNHTEETCLEKRKNIESCGDEHVTSS